MKCPNCSHEFDVNDAPPQKGAWTPIPAAVKGQAFTLSKMEACTEPDWKDFLKKLQGKSDWTPGMQKFYKLIHFKCTGTWPELGAVAKPMGTEDAPF